MLVKNLSHGIKAALGHFKIVQHPKFATNRLWFGPSQA